MPTAVASRVGERDFGLATSSWLSMPVSKSALVSSSDCLIGLDGAVVEVLQRILPAQFEVIFGQVRLLGEPLVFEVRGADLRGVLILANGVADAAPEVRLPRDIERQRECGEAAVANR